MWRVINEISEYEIRSTLDRILKCYISSFMVLSLHSLSLVHGQQFQFLNFHKMLFPFLWYNFISYFCSVQSSVHIFSSMGGHRPLLLWKFISNDFSSDVLRESLLYSETQHLMHLNCFLTCPQTWWKMVSFNEIPEVTFEVWKSMV